MILPSSAENELARLAELDRYAILDTPPEEAFDDVAKLAASLCEVPVALITLVDATRTWFKAGVGVDGMTHTPREISFCTHTIAQRDVCIVPDTLVDPRFVDNLLVQSVPGIRFYAGVPLTTAEGLNLGALCVLDRKPRALTEAQFTALRTLARQVMVQLELRREIAERRKAERELDGFFEVSIDLLCIASYDGYFTRLNPAFEDVLGYSLDELVSTPFLLLVHPDDRASTRTEMESLREGRTTIHFENRYLRKDGAIRWIAWTASPAPDEELIYAAGRDITRAKAAESELRRSEARTRSILDNALGSLVAMDEQGVIESVNPAAERTFGCSAGTLIGRSFDLLVEAPAFEQLRDAGRGRMTVCRGRRRSGELFTCEISMFEFYASDQQRHFAAHILDVSERHEVERMKTDFISTVNHELRTPLTSIVGSLGLLASGVMGELPEDARPMVTVAERNSVRLISLIDDILDFEKLECGKMEMTLQPASLRRLLERATASVSTLAVRHGVAIELGGVDAVAIVDEVRIAQVAANLLSNAVKYSQRGGTVKVTTSLADGWADVRVEDHGQGIAAALQAKLFQSFERVDSSDARTEPGTGLGLAICKAIVEQHHGTIGVESREGEGSMFWFRIRAVEMSAIIPLSAMFPRT